MSYYSEIQQNNEELGEILDAVNALPNGGSTSFTTDETLRFENGVLGVNTTDEAEADNTLPITSAGVHTQLGNIEILLGTI
jgi:hypothetical protein